MSDAAIPAFYAACCRHFRQLLQEGIRGPYLSTEPSSASSCFFCTSFMQVQEAFIIQDHDAVFIHTEAEIQPPAPSPELVLPHLYIFKLADGDDTEFSC